MANAYLKLMQEMMILMKKNQRPKEIMSIEELSDYLDLSTSYIYKLTCSRSIPHYKPLKKKIYFKRAEIDKWILAQPIEVRDKFIEKALLPLRINVKNHSK